MIVFSADIAGHVIVLAETQLWKGKGVDARAEVQQDPITTEFTPRLVAEPGSTTRLLTGYRITEHDQPGDTLVTYKLLLERDAAGALSGWWWEDHMEVPRSLWKVTGVQTGRTLTLTLSGEDARTVSGFLYERK